MTRNIVEPQAYEWWNSRAKQTLVVSGLQYIYLYLISNTDIFKSLEPSHCVHAVYGVFSGAAMPRGRADQAGMPDHRMFCLECVATPGLVRSAGRPLSAKDMYTNDEIDDYRNNEQ